MKKLVAIFLIVMASTNFSFADSIIIDKSGKRTELRTSTIVENGTTLVPMRYIFELMGATVNYDSFNKQIRSSVDDKTILLNLGSKTAFVNGNQSVLALNPRSVDGTTYVPVRFVAEALGATVDYAKKSNDTKGWTPYSSGDIETLAHNIAHGYVKYYNGQYWASAEFVAMLENEEIVYENDISAGTPSTDRYSLANLEVNLQK